MYPASSQPEDAQMLDLKAAAIAANRFGFGAKPGELAAIAPDPRGWLRQQLSPVAETKQQGSPSAMAAILV